MPSTVMAAPPALIVLPATEKADGFGVIVWPAMTKRPLVGDAAVGVGILKVLLPIIKAPEGPRLITVPSVVAAGPTTEIVIPAMERAEGFGVIVWPAITNALLAARIDFGVGMANELLPRTKRPDGPRLMIVPPIVCAKPLGEMVASLTVKAVGLAVKV